MSEFFRLALNMARESLGFSTFFGAVAPFVWLSPQRPPRPLYFTVQKMKLWARANVCQGQSQSQYSQYSVHQILRHRIWPYALSIEIVGYSDTFALSHIATMTVKWPNIVQTAEVLLNNLNWSLTGGLASSESCGRARRRLPRRATPPWPPPRRQRVLPGEGSPQGSHPLLRGHLLTC